MKKNGSFYNDRLLINLSKIYLFPIYIVALILKIFDFFKEKILNFIKYKILKRKKADKIEDWWII